MRKHLSICGLILDAAELISNKHLISLSYYYTTLKPSAAQTVDYSSLPEIEQLTSLPQHSDLNAPSLNFFPPNLKKSSRK